MTPAFLQLEVMKFESPSKLPQDSSASRGKLWVTDDLEDHVYEACLLICLSLQMSSSGGAFYFTLEIRKGLHSLIFCDISTHISNVKFFT